MKRGSMAVSSIKKKEKEQDKVRQKIAALHQNIGLVIKGKPEAISLAIITLLARGHLLIEDAPGVGKTLLAQSLAMSIHSSFQRIPFPSDLLPYPLPHPFMVIATQNPLEYQGTYPLPESQLDRFLMRTHMGYPPLAEEKEILSHPRIEEEVKRLEHVLSGQEVIAMQQMADEIRVAEEILNYIMAIVTATRNVGT